MQINSIKANTIGNKNHISFKKKDELDGQHRTTISFSEDEIREGATIGAAIAMYPALKIANKVSIPKTIAFGLVF